jgi:hypothetical protein
MKSEHGDHIIGEVDISDVSPTGRTRHTVAGIPVAKEAKLRLVRLAGDTSIYLIHYGPDEAELTDTCHETVAEALDQASFEYGIGKGDWTFFEES